MKANYPVTKFGHISMVSDEAWFLNPASHLMEQGYIVDLPNAPGLSGAPVYVFGSEVEANPFRVREVNPTIIGVIKALMLVPAGDAKISQGVAVIEPAYNVKQMIQKAATILKNQGEDIDLIN
jgi:hypothetical protein